MIKKLVRISLTSRHSTTNKLNMNIIILSIFILIIVIITIILWRRRNSTKNDNFLKKVPVISTSLPILGIALELRDTTEILNNLMRYVKNHGGVVQGKIGPLRTLVLVSDYKLLECILSSTKILTKSQEYKFLGPWLGKGLLTNDGSQWKKHRRILTPAFHFQILEQFIEIFESCGDILIKKLEEKTHDNSLDIYPYITMCSLDIICESIMGIRINAQSGNNVDYVRSVKEMCRIVIERATSPEQMHDLPYIFTKNYYTQKKALKILHEKSNNVIETRKKELANKIYIPKENNDEQILYFKNKKAFLDILLQSTVDGKSLTHEEIREEVDTFMFEGHDTTASALSFTLYCLANNPDVQQKAFEEQQNIFCDVANSTPTYADLQSMKYLDNVIKESLRLYPSVPFYAREVTEDVMFGDDYLPKGITLIIFAYGIHRHPDYYKDPEKFDAERFENMDNRQPYAYLPFSAGPRNCIGQKFAMLELKSVVSKILRKFVLKPASPHHSLKLAAETILKSANGVKISLEVR